jgi:hypothetical protein
MTIRYSGIDYFVSAPFTPGCAILLLSHTYYVTLFSAVTPTIVAANGLGRQIYAQRRRQRARQSKSWLLGANLSSYSPPKRPRSVSHGRSSKPADAQRLSTIQIFNAHQTVHDQDITSMDREIRGDDIATVMTMNRVIIDIGGWGLRHWLVLSRLSCSVILFNHLHTIWPTTPKMDIKDHA